MFITKRHISRRTMLRGIGASVALPFLESMMPAMTPMRRTAAGNPRLRLVCCEMVHGSAGATRFGEQKNMWSPAEVGRDFDLTPSSLQPLEPWKDALTIISNTDMRGAEAWEPHELGGDHFRSSAVFLTQAHPKHTQSSDVRSGTSFDQVYAHRFGQDTPLPSIQLSIESVDQSGGCMYGYSCVYTDTLSWETPTKPLPMVRDPRMVFDQLFGVGGDEQERLQRRREDRSVLDFLTHRVASLKAGLGPADRQKLDEYLENIREIERRITRIEQQNSSGATRELPTAPIGVPDSWEEHVKLMFDLQLLAFVGNITRVSSFKMSRDVNGRVFPPTGVNTGFHNASHHGENEQRITQFAAINKYHISVLAYFIDKLAKTKEADGTLLDQTLLLYGSPLGNSNLHNHKRVPLILLGHAGGKLKGHLHVKPPDGTPSANVFLTLFHRIGFEDMAYFGDSTGEVDI
ncbi:MAG: DUF1552 domain-containing protein [Acidobacteria bacterium]|nr:DUF1552 domain-containing protein [Acidobacteriota bacterium]